MKILSQIDGGHTRTGEPLIKVGENVIDYKGAPLEHREFIDVMVEAGFMSIVEPDPDATIIPFPQATQPLPAVDDAPAAPAAEVPARAGTVVKKRRRRAG